MRRVKGNITGRETSDKRGELHEGLLTRIHKSAREETMSATSAGEIGKVESVIDERVKSLDGM
jgi:hypothetical protein